MTHKQVSYNNRQSTKIDEIKEHMKKYKNKRFRSAFTTTQIVLLEQEYKKNAYLNNTRREDLSNKLNLSERTIKIWFQNRRMKEKRETTKQTDEAESVAKEIPRSNIIVNTFNVKSQENAVNVEHSSHLRNIIVEPKRANTSDIKQVNKIRTEEENSKVTNKNESKAATIIKEDNGREDFCSKEEFKLKPIEYRNKYKNISMLENSNSPVTDDKTASNNCMESKYMKDHTFINDKRENYEKQADTNVPIDLSKYYPVMANQGPPYNLDSYNLVPIIATGHTINRPYMLPNPNLSSSSNLYRNTPNLRKCNCNCHNDEFVNQSIMNFQPNLPFLYTNYLPHILGVNNHNSS